MKHPFTFNQFITMILSHQISRVFMFNSQQVEWSGEKGKEAGEGDREQWKNGVRKGALVINGSGVGQKWTLVKLNA